MSCSSIIHRYCLVVRVFAKDPGDGGSIPGRVIPKTQKWFLIPPCLTLSIIRYGSMVKWINPGEGVVPFHTPRCRSYLKGTFTFSSTIVGKFLLLYIQPVTVSRVQCDTRSIFWQSTTGVNLIFRLQD